MTGRATIGRGELLAALGLTRPIVQAPMAGVDTPALAAAVCEAGALGSVAIGALDVAAARAAIQETRARTGRAFNINAFCHADPRADAGREARWLSYLAPSFAEFGAAPPATLRAIYRSFVGHDAMLAMLVEECPRVVSFHFGLPDAAAIAALHVAGIVLLATATSVDEARQVEAAGIDAIVVQGIEAGGHRGVFDPAGIDEGLGTLALVRQVVQATTRPVIAAGGIMDGAGIAAALALGAEAAQLGTAFVACPESAADPAFRAALLARPPRATVMTAAISGRVARGLANRFTALGAADEAPPVPDYPIAYDAGKSLHRAARARGSAEFAAQWAGQGAALARALPAAALVEALDAELRAALAGLAALANV